MRHLQIAAWVLAALMGWGCGEARRGEEPGVGGSTAAPMPGAASRTVELAADGRRVLEIPPGETHLYPILLQAGEAARLTLDQQGVDVSLVLVDPEGRERLEMDRPIGDRGEEWVSMVAETPGTWRVEVRSGSWNPAAGRYEAHLEGPRPATPQDPPRMVAEAAFVAARQLRKKARKAVDVASADALLGQAAGAYRRAFEAWRAAAEPRGQGMALFGLGETLASLRRWDEAFETQQRALPLLEQAGEHSHLAAAHNTLGVVHLLRREIPEAVAAYRQALRFAELSSNSPAELTALENLATADLVSRRPLQALAGFAQLLERSRQAQDRDRVGLLQKVAQAYLELGQHESALDYLDEALAIVRQRGGGADAAPILASMARADLFLGQAERARQRLEEALSLLPPGEQVLERAAMLNSLGGAWRRLGRLPEALAAYGEALERYRAHGDSRNITVVEMNRAWVLDALGDPREALTHYQRVLASFRQTGDRSGEASALYGMARALAHGDQLPAAQAAVEEALALVEARREELAGDALGQLFGASKHDYFAFYVDLLIERHLREPGAGWDARALEASERGRAWSLETALREARAGIRRGIEPELARRREALWSRMAALHWQREVGAAAGPTLEAELRDLGTELDLLEAEIRSTSPSYAALTRPPPPDLGELESELLDADTRLLVYTLGAERSFLFLIDRDGLEWRELPPRAELEAAARDAWEKLAGSRRRTSWRSLARSLRDLAATVLPPAADLTSRRLVVVPDGALHYLPFAALPEPGSGEGEPLVARHEVVTLPSLAALAELRQRAAGRAEPPGVVAVFADPVFGPDDPRLGDAAGAAGIDAVLDPLDRLVDSEAEVEVLEALVPADRRLVVRGFDATPEAVLGAPLDRYRILHFATHGFFDARLPQLSRLVLSRLDRQGRAHDGNLYLHDIYNLHLPIDLVVLSACETALGREVRGEGLVGLTRGFLYAGAPRVVVSLWPVQDPATAELMSRFYRGLLGEGLTPAAALRQAQDSVRRQPRWRAPVYWAGFVLQGDWR